MISLATLKLISSLQLLEGDTEVIVVQPNGVVTTLTVREEVALDEEEEPACACE